MSGVLEELVRWAGIVAVVWIVYRPHRERRPRPGPPSPAITEEFNLLAEAARELQATNREARLQMHRDVMRSQAELNATLALLHEPPPRRATSYPPNPPGLLTEADAVRIFDQTGRTIRMEDL